MTAVPQCLLVHFPTPTCLISLHSAINHTSSLKPILWSSVFCLYCKSCFPSSLYWILPLQFIICLSTVKRQLSVGGKCTVNCRWMSQAKGSLETNMPGGSAVRTVMDQRLATHHSTEMAKVEMAPLGTAQTQLKGGKMKSLHYISEALILPLHPSVSI